MVLPVPAKAILKPVSAMQRRPTRRMSQSSLAMTRLCRTASWPVRMSCWFLRDSSRVWLTQLYALRYGTLPWFAALAVLPIRWSM